VTSDEKGASGARDVANEGLCARQYLFGGGQAGFWLSLVWFADGTWRRGTATSLVLGSEVEKASESQMLGRGNAWAIRTRDKVDAVR